MNPYLDDELRALAEQARRFAGDRIAPGFKERDQTRVLDRGLMREMGALGLIAPALPERFDCHGQRAIGRGSLHFENVRVPADHLLGAGARRTPGRRLLKMPAEATVSVRANLWTRAQRGRRHPAPTTQSTHCSPGRRTRALTTSGWRHG